MRFSFLVLPPGELAGARHSSLNAEPGEDPPLKDEPTDEEKHHEKRVVHQ
jgi:hypothetical protein